MRQFLNLKLFILSTFALLLSLFLGFVAFFCFFFDSCVVHSGAKQETSLDATNHAGRKAYTALIFSVLNNVVCFFFTLFKLIGGGKYIDNNANVGPNSILAFGL